MDKISFSVMQLIKEEKKAGSRFVEPDYETFKDIETSFHITLDNVYYEVTIEKTQEYIWFVFDYGKPDPIDDKLTNIETGEKKDNPRTIKEAELLKQLFVMYYFDKKLLFISNSNKQKFFEEILKEKLEYNFFTSKIYKNINEFIEIVNEINEISFTEIKHLFSQDTKTRKALIDLTGVDAPESFTIRAEYSEKNGLIDNILPFLSKLSRSKDNNELSELIIRGRDESGFETVFNADTFMQKIPISCSKNEKGKFDSEIVKQELIKKIENEK